MSATDAQVNVPFFKKKSKGRPATARKRSVSPAPDARSSQPTPSTSKSQVVLPSKKAASGLLSAGTKRTASQREGHDDLDGPERDGPDVKWTAEGSHRKAALEILAGDEAEELLAKRRRREKELEGGSDDDDIPDDGQYRGQNAYKKHIKKTTETPKAMRVGPQRSTNTIRTVTIVDYQPDVCKDYKETGYCGFGDTCKFLHDRGTYLAGWQLDKLAADPKRQAQDESSDDDSDDEDIPFACLICRKPYTDPVVTRCNHYYCSACAIKRYAKNPRCLACGTATGGIFNRADKVIEKLNKKRKSREEDKDGEEGGDVGGVEIEGLGAADADHSPSEDSDPE